MNVKTRNHEKKSNVMCQYTGPFSLFTRIFNKLFFKTSTCGLLQIVGIEKCVFFSYMIHEDTLKSWKCGRFEKSGISDKMYTFEKF